MAEQKRWFKVWTSILSNARFDTERPEGIEWLGRFLWLAAYAAVHGKNGHVGIPHVTLERKLRASLAQIRTDSVFKNVNFSPSKCDGEISVTFKNWHKYQIDSSVDRTARWRQNVTEQKRREEIRREEIRREETYSPIILSNGVTPFTAPSPRKNLSTISKTGPWPSVEALVTLYNEQSPDECPAVQPPISEAREKKARTYLKQFPEQAYWEQVFQQIKDSPFCRGLRNNDGRKFTATFDWLLSRGKDGTENVVKVHDGHYFN